MLGHCEAYVLEERLVELAHALMLRRGAKGYETGFYLAARIDGNTCIIDTLCIPHQEAYSVEEGCALIIPGSEVTRLGHLAQEKGRQFCGQLHSHPDDAFHSRPDDTAPAMRFDGALSIVTPRFGVDGMLPSDVAIFRFDVARPGWTALKGRRRRMVQIAGTGGFEVIGLD